MTPAQVKTLLQKTSEAIEKMTAEADATENSNDLDFAELQTLSAQARKMAEKVGKLQTRIQERAETDSDHADGLTDLQTQLEDLATELDRFTESDEEEEDDEGEDDEEEEEEPDSED